LLCQNQVDAIVAVASPVSEATVIGMITIRDILTALLLRKGTLQRLRVIDVLARNPLVLNESDDIERAIHGLRARGAKYAPVVGSGGTLKGLISMNALLNCSTRGQPSYDSTESC
jgi:CBS domain-containing protein